MPADYDGDNRIDIAVFRQSTGNWYWINSSDGQAQTRHWGADGDIPVSGDYDGDGNDDIAVYRAGTWYVDLSAGGQITSQFGLPTELPFLRSTFLKFYVWF